MPSTLTRAVRIANEEGVELSPTELVRLAGVIAEDRKAQALERIAQALEDLP
jgi:hypothetical protein